MIEIKDISGKTRFSTPINKGAKGKFTLMKEDYIILPFSVSEPIPFKLGDYVDLAGVLDESLGGKMSKIYEITDIQKPTYNTSTGGYDYNLQMNAYYWKWKNKIFKYTPENAGSEASWSLTASLDVQLGVFLRNLKALGYTYRGQDFEFEIDSTVENKAVAMTYDNINLLDALFSMAGEDQWNCDCWITDNVIHFGRCEFGDAVKIERGVEASSITRSESQGTYATRIYAFGSTKNIPTNYRPTDEQAVVNGVVQKRLMLPSGTPYIDAYEGMSQEEAIEDVVVFDDVYPRRVGTLSDVHTRTEEVDNEDGTKETVTYYRYKDTGLEFKEEYIIEGQELQITFQSGKLNGMTFGVIFNPTPKDETRGEQLWEIVRNEDYGRPLPDDIMYPANGDEYILSGFDIQLVSDQYIPEAEQELKEKAQKYADKVKTDDGTYPTTLRSDWVKGDLISRTFDFGQRINLVDDTFFEDGRISRVLGWEMNLDIPWDSPVYTIGESMPYSRIEEIEDKVDSLVFNGQTYTGIYGSGGSKIYVIKTNDSTSASDNNVFSALRSLATFLRKDKEDSTSHLLTLLAGAIFGENKASIGADGVAKFVSMIINEGKASIAADGAAVLLSAIFNGGKASIASDGASKFLSTIINGGKASIDADGLLTVINAIVKGDIKSDNFLAGALGSGYAILKKDQDGKSYLEVDKLFARVKAIFAVLEIMKVTYTGGNFVFSPAGMNCTKVEEYDTYYRCYFTADDGEKAVENTFEVDDFVQLREFNVKPGVYENVSNRYFWRRCIAKGSDYIDLSKSDRDMTSDDAPMAGDSLVTIGNKTIKSRQNVIIISVYGEGSPSIIQYAGVSDYSLDGKAVTVISPNGNKFTGSFIVQATGKNVEDEISAAVEVASAAKKAADQAQKDADKANTELNTIASDNYITPSEKTALKQQQADIQAERNEIVANATKYGVSYTAYDAAYTLANNALTKYTASSPQNIEVGSDYSNISAYYAARKIILDSISTAAKKLVDDTNSDLQNYKKTVTQEFEAADGRLTSAITETKNYTDNAIGNIQVGGRNLARGTSSEWCNPINLTNLENQCLTGFSGRIYTDTLKEGDEIVISFDYKWENFVYGSNWGMSLQGTGNITSWNSGQFPPLHIRNLNLISGENGSVHISYSATITANHLKNQYWNVNLRHDYIIGSASVRNFKVEKGNKATAWSPAPEDSIDQMLQGSVGNYILNSAFDNGTSNWVGEGSLVISVDTETHHQAGVNTLKVVQSAAANTALTGTRVYQGATKLSPASLSFWVKASKETQFKVRLGGNESYTKTITINTEWQRVKIENTYPSTIYVLFGALSACTWWLSEPILTNTTTAYNWQPSNKDVVKRIEDNSSKIEQLPDQITFTVEQKIGEIQIGGRNLLKNSNEVISGVGSVDIKANLTDGFIIEEGKEYTIGYDYEYSRVSTGSAENQSRFVIQFVFSINGGSNNYNMLTANLSLPTSSSSLEGNGRATGTIKIPSGATKINQIGVYRQVLSGDVSITNIKLEGGNKATAWTPAPEDIDDSLTTLSSEIKQTADSITSTVKKEIGDITIGGDNCISNSDFSGGTSGWSYSSVTISADNSNTHVSGISVLRVVQASASDSNLDSIRIFQYAGISVGDTVSFSCWVKASIATKIKIRLCGGSKNLKEFSVDTSWTYITFENVTASSTAVILGATSACTWYLSEPMLVKANKATSWAKKLSEQVSEISTIKQTANSISLKVDDINDGLSATGIDITSKKIDITADKLSIKTNSGKSVAVFDGTGDVPKLKADYIDAKNLSVSFLQTNNTETPVKLYVNGDNATINYSAIDSVGMTSYRLDSTMGGIYEANGTGILGAYWEINGYRKIAGTAGMSKLYALFGNEEIVMIDKGNRRRCRFSSECIMLDFLNYDGSAVTRSFAFGGSGTQIYAEGKYYSGYNGTFQGQLVRDGIICGNNPLTEPYYKIDENDYLTY